ncbi:cyclin-dependent kinase-like 5 [Sebastes umbrosus]|uniref:cyclin-dependent kinase-like 5 n=1 Tax=Sebastes umbrosus TaxID=72105 RepID=UPI00189D5989|nr:cyclin-dependent kinase-like 5 [Sebastes umbrosus]XP_037615002.1 cyclin-dependent kinase-like 5 [Sebastes umbrosus]
MERYESLGLVGEGSYGTVLKCRHRDSGRLVAIKKFVDSDDDKTVKKIALREIKLLRQLRHDNLVNLLEVWKRRRRWYLVFEFVERTLLDDLEQNPSGLDLDTGRQYLYQILRAAAFCHQQNIIHRDIKPENILISQGGVVKMCDFGFARTMTSPAEAGIYTDYVATRWYRAPELLVGDTKYGKPVDVWAVGCLLLEMLTGQPLFPGDSDLDQIYHIVRCFGNLTAQHQELFYRNPVFSGVRLHDYSGRVRLEQRFPTITPTALDLAQSCLQMDPERRPQCSDLQEHPLFTQDSFHIRFLDELNAKIQKDHRENSTLPKITKTPRRERNDGDDKNRRSKDKKQPEDVDEKVNKETKGKQLSKLSKTIRNTSEPSMSTSTSTSTSNSTKQSKTLGAKIIDNAAKTTVAMKGKPGKATGVDLRKEPDIHLTQKTGKMSTTEYLDGASTTSKISNSDQVLTLQASQPSSDDRIEVATPSVTKPCKTTKTSEYCSNMDTEQRWTFECPKVLPSNPKPSKTTSNFGPKMTKNTSLSTSPSKTLTSDLSRQSSAHSTTTLPKETSNLSSDTKATNDTTRVPDKPSRGLPTNGELTEVSNATRTQQDSRSNKDFKEDHGCLMMSPVTKTAANHVEISDASGGDYKECAESSDPCSVHLQSTSKSKTTTSMPNEISKTSTSVGTAILKTLKVSDKENREDLALSLSINATPRSLLNQTLQVSGNSYNEQKSNSNEAEPNKKSLKPPHFKPLIGEPKTKLGSFSNYAATMTLKRTAFPSEARKKRDNPEKDDTTIADSTSFTSTATPDRKASTRSSVFHNVDTTDFSVTHSSSPPPPPPPPSSTPLLLTPSSTPLIPSFSVVSPATSDHLSMGAGFHPGTHGLRCVDKPRHHGGVYSQMSSHITGSHTAQVSEKNLICERPFLSDRCNLGNSGGVIATKKKSDIHFPDLRSSALPELRGREGKHNKGTSKDQRKDKQPLPPSEPHQHGHNSTDTPDNTITTCIPLL